MTTIAWVTHNNASSAARQIVEGLHDLGRTDLEHIASREDVLGLREPELAGVPLDRIGKFPDRTAFAEELASPNFWHRLRSADFIVFTINGGPNHNAYRAAEIIRRHDLFDRVVYLDEEEGGFLHADFRDMFLKSRLAVMAFRPRPYQEFRVHPHVVFFGFHGVENRYLRFAPPTLDEKPINVFFRGRMGGGLPMHRAPFIEALHDRRYPDSAINPELEENTDAFDLRWQHISGNRHNATYYRMLAKARIAVYLNGFNPMGYQFWENAALGAAQVMQSPKPTQWYPGGAYVVDKIDFEHYDPPFRENEHFLLFETPDEMFEKIDWLIAHDDERRAMAERTRALALAQYTSRARAERFLAYLSREL